MFTQSYRLLLDVTECYRRNLRKYLPCRYLRHLMVKKPCEGVALQHFGPNRGMGGIESRELKVKKSECRRWPRVSSLNLAQDWSFDTGRFSLAIV